MCPLANGADFPKKTIKIIACAAAGGGEDTEARGIAPYLEKYLGVSVMIENQPGAGGKIAFEKFQRTEPEIQAGMLRPLILFGDKRDPYFPDVPIPKDLGFDITPIPGIRGVEAPPKTPASVVKVLEEACGKAIKEPAFIEFAKRRQMVLHLMSSQEFRQIVDLTYPKVEKFQSMLKEK